MANQSHDAAASALGYLFQTKWPLIALLRRARVQPDCKITLELGDDVVFTEGGSPQELIQAKHHINRKTTLTDKSVDLWKTIAVWLDSGSPSDLDGPALVLLTTAIPKEGSAASSLGTDCRDNPKAAGLLYQAAQSSDSIETKSPRERFISLSITEREAFVSRITILGGGPHVEDLDELLLEELYWAAPTGHEELFLGLVWDWWFRQAIEILNRTLCGVDGMAVRATIDELRDKFSEGNLPTLVHRDAFDPSTMTEYSQRVFVRQLDLVEPPSLILERAIQDYFRAYTQSALWIENNLVGLTEIANFEADLQDEWEREFAWMLSQIPEDASEERKRQAGRDLLHKCLDSTQIQLRESYREPFFVRGRTHHLVDLERAGWHPDFEEALRAMLLGSGHE